MTEPAPPRQPFAGFDRAAARAYDAWYDQPGGRAAADEEEQLIARLLRRLPAAATVLEVGCGTGYFSRRLAGRGLRVTGVDAAAGMLAVAGERGGGPAYVRAAAEALPFADGSVDAALFLTSLEFIGDADAALREAARVSRHGLVLGVLNLASPLGLWRKAEARLRPSPFRTARFRTPWGLRRELRRTLGEQAGAISMETVIWPCWLPSPLRRLPCGGFIGAVVSFRSGETR